MDVNELKKIYIKLNALNDALFQTTARNPSASLSDNSWDSYNSNLDKLSTLTSDDHYTTLKVTPNQVGRRSVLLASNFSIKAYQAVKYLHDMYGGDELSTQSAPSKPQTTNSNSGHTFSQTSVVTQDQDNTQSQVTDVHIEFNQTLTYINEVIFESRSKYEEGTKERTFLDKLKDGIVTAKTTADLVKIILTTAVQCGISTEFLAEIFK